MNQRLSEDTRFEACKDTKNPRPRAKDQLLENRHSRGQGQEGSRPRPKDTRLKCSPKKGLQKVFFRRSLKKGLCKFCARFLKFSNKILPIQKIVLSSTKDRAIFEDLRLRGQGQGLDLRGRGLQNLLSRISPLVLTFSFCCCALDTESCYQHWISCSLN